MVQLSVLNRRFRKDENNPSSLMQASLSNLYIVSRVKGKKPLVRNQSKQKLFTKKRMLHTWNRTDDEDDSPVFEKLKPLPLHNRRRMFITGIQDLLSNADNKALGILWVAASLLSKAAKYSLYCTRTDIDWRRRSLRSALDILGSLK